MAKDKDFSPEALVIVALMRKLDISELDCSDLNFQEPDSLTLTNNYILLKEKIT